jgi:hypothetical protein
MNIALRTPLGEQYKSALKYCLGSPLEVAHTSKDDDLFIDAASAKVMDFGACCAVNGAVSGVVMLSALPAIAVGLTAKAAMSPSWCKKALAVPALPTGVVLGSFSACGNLLQGGAMVLFGATAMVVGASFLPVELAQRELERAAERHAPTRER